MLQHQTGFSVVLGIGQKKKKKLCPEDCSEDVPALAALEAECG